MKLQFNYLIVLVVAAVFVCTGDIVTLYSTYHCRCRLSLLAVVDVALPFYTLGKILDTNRQRRGNSIPRL